MLFLLKNWQLILIAALIGLCGFKFWESRERGFAIENMKVTIGEFAKANETNLATIATLKAEAEKDLQLIQKQHEESTNNTNALNQKEKDFQNAKERDAVAAPVLNDAIEFLRQHTGNHQN